MLIWVDFGNRVVDIVWLPMCARNKGHAIQGRDEPEKFGVFARSLFKLEPAVRKDTEDRLSEYDIKHLLTLTSWTPSPPIHEVLVLCESITLCPCARS